MRLMRLVRLVRVMRVMRVMWLLLLLIEVLLLMRRDGGSVGTARRLGHVISPPRSFASSVLRSASLRSVASRRRVTFYARV